MKRKRSWKAFLWMAAADVVGRIKEAVLALRCNTAIVLAMCGKIVWLLPLLVANNLFATYPVFYKPFADMWPQSTWAALMALFILLDIGALALNRFTTDLSVLIIGVFLFSTLAALAAFGAPAGRLGLPASLFFYVYAVGSLGCLFGALRRVSEWGVLVDAVGLMRGRRAWEDEVDAILRDNAAKMGGTQTL